MNASHPLLKFKLGRLAWQCARSTARASSCLWWREECARLPLSIYLQGVLAIRAKSTILRTNQEHYRCLAQLRRARMLRVHRFDGTIAQLTLPRRHLPDARQGGERRSWIIRISVGFPFRSNLTAAALSGEWLFADVALGPRQVLLPSLELRVLTQSRSGARFQSRFNSAGRHKLRLRGGSFRKLRQLPHARARVRVPDSMERSRGWARDRR